MTQLERTNSLLLRVFERSNKPTAAVLRPNQ